MNEAKPFCCFSTQNLFKLASEKETRTKLIDGDPNNQARDENLEKDQQPLNNAAIKLLDESEDEVKECVVQPEKDIK